MSGDLGGQMQRLLSIDAGNAEDWTRIDTMLARLDTLRSAFPDDREIVLTETKAAVNISNAARNTKDWPRIDTMLARLDVIVEQFSADLVIGQSNENDLTLGDLRRYLVGIRKSGQTDLES
ncbi:hypothetical protein J7399_19455 [Shimia sp. R9_1]|uniref:hypothetical protein n=1 Tax=Shimia sp. R9_1 TaxID=2821111 RepID=UPI001AD9CB40|nr:hypothetical protein [Shimia sp. R9_1]MBO9409623.1 hypothetical protein [Shimia sp. R9_1]